MTTPEFYDLIKCAIKVGQQNLDSDAFSLYPRISRNAFTQKFTEFRIRFCKIFIYRIFKK